MILALLVPKAHFLQFPKPTYILVPKALFGNEGGVSITRRVGLCENDFFKLKLSPSLTLPPIEGKGKCLRQKEIGPSPK